MQSPIISSKGKINIDSTIQKGEKDYIFSKNFNPDKSNMTQTIMGSTKKNTMQNFRNDYTPIVQKSFSRYDTEANIIPQSNPKKNKDVLSKI